VIDKKKCLDMCVREIQKEKTRERERVRESEGTRERENVCVCECVHDYLEFPAKLTSDGN